MPHLHATCVSLGAQGVLLLGESGSGKSDLALRLIRQEGATLVADDQVWLETGTDGLLRASPPEKLAGLLEIRQLGIVTLPYFVHVPLVLVVELVRERESLERFPETQEYMMLEGFNLPILKLYPFDASTPAKIALAQQRLPPL